MREYEPTPGETIQVASAMLCELAPARMQFNGITIEAEVGDDPGKVVQKYYRSMELADEAYRNSPAGKAAIKREEEASVQCRKNKEALLAQLRNGIGTDLQERLAWMTKLESTTNGLNRQESAAVLADYEAAGFRIGEGVGTKPESFTYTTLCRWIIGQCMDGIKSIGAPHGVVHHFASLAENLRRKEGKQ